MHIIIKTKQTIIIQCCKDYKTALKTEIGLTEHKLHDLLIYHPCPRSSYWCTSWPNARMFNLGQGCPIFPKLVLNDHISLS